MRLWRGACVGEVRAFRAALRNSSLARSRLSASTGLFAIAHSLYAPIIFVIAGGPRSGDNIQNCRREKTAPHTPTIPAAGAHRLFARHPQPCPRFLANQECPHYSCGMYQPPQRDERFHWPDALSIRAMKPRSPFSSTDSHAFCFDESNTTRDIAM